MAVYVHPEPKEFKRDVPENCISCRQPTRTWLDPHTPLCETCAAKWPDDVESLAQALFRIETNLMVLDKHSDHSPNAILAGVDIVRDLEALKALRLDIAAVRTEMAKVRGFDLLLKHLASIMPTAVAIKKLSGMSFVEAVQGYVLVPRQDWERYLRMVERVPKDGKK